MITIEVKHVIENDVFGCKYKAIYLNEQLQHGECGGVYGGKIQLDINKNDEIFINTQAYNNNQTTLIVGMKYEVEGLFELYAKNPNNGAILNVFKCKLTKSRL